MLLRRLTPQVALHSHLLPACYSSAAQKASPVLVERLVNGSTQKPNGIVVLRLNNPSQLNALSVDIGNVFEKTIQELKQDDSIRAVILTGEGKGFSAGGDLDFLHKRSLTTSSDNARTMRRFYERFLTIRQLPVPTIAAINGHAVGAGFAICFACDLRLASEDAKMGFNFVKLGISPGMGSSFFVPKLLGMQAAARMLLTGDLVSAQEAHSMGMLLSVHKKEDVLQEAIKLAERIATASPLAVRETTKTLRMQLDEGLEAALMREADTQAHCYAGTDLKIGLEAVKAKKDPVFPDFKVGTDLPIPGSASPAEEKNKPGPGAGGLFSQVDLRVGRVLSIKKHPNAELLYVEEIDLGEARPRTVCSGLVKYLRPEDILEKNVIVVCNLKPASMRGVTSEAMLLAASSTDRSKVELLVPPEGSKPGDRVFAEGHQGKDFEILNPKKKVWEKIVPDLRTNAEGTATFMDIPLQTSSGMIKAPSLCNGNVS